MYFRQGCHTGQSHVFDLLVGGHVFAPQVGLCTDDVFLLFRSQLVGRDGFERINLLDRQVTAVGEGFFFHTVGLVEVEVDKAVRTHNDRVLLPGGFDTASHAAPAHDGCLRGKTSFQYLVPTDDLPSFAVHETFDTGHDIAL